MKANIVVFIFMFSMTLAYSQPYLMRTFGTPINDYPIGFAKDSDTTLLFCGWRSSVDGVIIKTNLLGDTLFSRIYPFLDVVSDFVKLTEEQYLIIDESNNKISIKADGTINWQQSGGNTNNRLFIKAAAVAGENQFVVTGEVDVFDHMQFVPDYGMDSVFQKDIFIGLYDFEGNLIQCDTILVSDEDDYARDIIFNNNEYHIIGYSYVYSMPNTFILRLDNEFNIDMNYVYEYDNIFSPNSFVIDVSGNYIITGTKWLSSNNRHDMFLIKYDEEGGLIWERCFNYTDYEYGHDMGEKVIENSDGSFSALGIANNGPNTQHLLLVKVSAEGTILVNELIDNTGFKTACSLIELGENKLAVFGCTNYNTDGMSDFLYIVCDSLGDFPVGVHGVSNTNKTGFYPNPAVNQVTVFSGSDNFITTISIFSLTGSLLFKESKLITQNHDISPNLHPGSYIISISLSNGSVVHKKLLIE